MENIEEKKLNPTRNFGNNEFPISGGVKKIVFLTGTRADFSKIKSLLLILEKSKEFEPHVFVTGMHLDPKHGETVREIEKCSLSNIYKFISHTNVYGQDIALSETIRGFSDYVKSSNPDMIVVHGDRLEPLAGALVGAFNNILVSHIEGGEISGSIDEHIRHAVSKLSHFHFVANEEAKQRLKQMGESEKAIFVIGSPDIDIMNSSDLPNWTKVKQRYKIPFDDFALLVFHPVTTEQNNFLSDTNQLVDAVLESGLNYVVIHPNNDLGTDIISSIYEKKLSPLSRIVTFPSLRFEHFLSLLKKTKFVIGNSSLGVREAPYYGVPVINVGNRQKNRIKNCSIENVCHCDFSKENILSLIKKITDSRVFYQPSQPFGSGDSDKKFFEILLNNDELWSANIQKQFLDIDF